MVRGPTAKLGSATEAMKICAEAGTGTTKNESAARKRTLRARAIGR